jgi:hypothetical protein
VQLAVSVKLEAGMTKQADAVTWESSNPLVATVSPTGFVTTTGFGGADITVRGYGTAAKTHAFAPAPPVARLAITLDAHGSVAAVVGSSVTFDVSASTGTDLAVPNSQWSRCHRFLYLPNCPG